MDESNHVGFVHVDESFNSVIVRPGDILEGRKVKRVKFAEPSFDGKPLITEIVVEDGTLGEKSIFLEHASLYKKGKK